MTTKLKSVPRKVIKRKVYNGWICPWHVVSDIRETVASLMERHRYWDEPRKKCKITLEVFEDATPPKRTKGKSK